MMSCVVRVRQCHNYLFIFILNVHHESIGSLFFVIDLTVHCYWFNNALRIMRHFDPHRMYLFITVPVY